MRILPVVSVLGFIGAASAVTWSVFSRPTDVYITHEVADSFNLQEVAAPAALPAAELMRDAVASAQPVILTAPSSLTPPRADSGLGVGAASKESAGAARRAAAATKAEAWAKKHVILAALFAKPAAFLMSRTALGSPSGLSAFLGNAKKVDAYMNSPLTRIVLANPAVARTLLGNPAVVGAFLDTPAMRDSKTVSALLASPMLKKILDCPAIIETLGDPVIMGKITSDSRTMSWIAMNPRAMMVIGIGG